MCPEEVLIKLFIGYPLTSEIRMYLHESRAWKQTLIAPQQERDLIETHFQKQNYIGNFLIEKEAPFSELRDWQIKVQISLQNYCPKLELDSLICCIFPQIFLP